MNKSTMFLLKLGVILSAPVLSGLEFIRGAKQDYGYGSGPEGIPNRGGAHRHRPHAPNDGRWHLKFHRNRR